MRDLPTRLDFRSKAFAPPRYKQTVANPIEIVFGVINSLRGLPRSIDSFLL